MCSHGLRLYTLVVQDTDYAVGKFQHGDMDVFKPDLLFAGKEGVVVATHNCGSKFRIKFDP